MEPTIGAASSRRSAMFAEEVNEDALRLCRASTTTVKQIALQLRLKHLFCDPTHEERRANTIVKENHDRREQYWLSRLKDHLNNETILFVCRAAHLKGVHKKLLDLGVEVQVFSEQFAIDLPPIQLTEKYGEFPEDL